MKKALLIICLLILKVAAMACPACEKKQPEIFRGITHGAGPGSNWDYVIVSTSVLIVLVTLFYTIKWVIVPREKSMDHIKRTVLN